ncbi:MAG: M48 family metallopeptidase [Selenomonadaceae bacterium]|nr:M48 family metallopeptidase [Selenomonadaceae bacterium]
MKSFVKKIAAGVTAASFAFAVAATPTAQAISVGDAIQIGGAIIVGNEQMKQAKKQIDLINNTEEGRQALYQKFREEYGVCEDEAINTRLDAIMANLSKGVSKVDPTINDKPYLYFINTDDTVNAGCGMGHVMMVNKGTFNFFATDDEIAAIVGHEMGHGQKDHAAKSIKNNINQQMVAQIGVAAAGGTTLATIIGSLALTNVIADYGRGKEAEADNLAWDYMLNTNYNIGATAAVMQKFVEQNIGGKRSGLASVFNPSDHPDSEKRRDNYAKKLFEYSKKHAEVDKKTGVVLVNKKEFVTPAATAGMSSAERAYFVLGNLATAYHKGYDKQEAYASNGTVYLGNQAIMTPTADDVDAETLAKLLNEIK